MTMSKYSYRLVLLGFSAATIFSSPVQAQSAAESPEALADAALQVDTGMTLARRQIGETDLLGATGTLERVLLAHPQASDARLLYASLLCRLDDPDGAGVEIGLLAPEAITEEAWREVTDACGPVARPPQAPRTTPEGGLQQ